MCSLTCGAAIGTSCLASHPVKQCRLARISAVARTKISVMAELLGFDAILAIAVNGLYPVAIYLAAEFHLRVSDATSTTAAVTNNTTALSCGVSDDTAPPLRY